VRGLPRQYRPKPYFKDLSVYVHWPCAALMTAASALITVVEPAFWSVFGLVFSGFSLVLAEATRRQRLDDKTCNRLEPFLQRLGRRDVDGYRWLLRVLATIDGRTPRAHRRSRVALAAIAADERLLDGLIWHCRHGQVSVAVFAGRLGRLGAAGLAPVLASLHPDGHIRQAAVTAMGRNPVGFAHLPFLMERANDWVPEVRAATHQVLRSQLGQHPGLSAPARHAFERVARRRHAPALRALIYG
jgi:hypothetical protein